MGIFRRVRRVVEHGQGPPDLRRHRLLRPRPMGRDIHPARSESDPRTPRIGTGLSGPFQMTVPRSFMAAGQGGVPPTETVAVTGNVTLTQPPPATCSSDRSICHADQLDAKRPRRRQPSQRHRCRTGRGRVHRRRLGRYDADLQIAHALRRDRLLQVTATRPATSARAGCHFGLFRRAALPWND